MIRNNTILFIIFNQAVSLENCESKVIYFFVFWMHKTLACMLNLYVWFLGLGCTIKIQNFEELKQNYTYFFQKKSPS